MQKLRGFFGCVSQDCVVRIRITALEGALGEEE